MAVNLGREEALGADRGQTQHPLQRVSRRGASRQGQGLELVVGALELKGLVWHLAQDLFQIEVNSREGVLGGLLVHELDAT